MSGRGPPDDDPNGGRGPRRNKWLRPPEEAGEGGVAIRQRIDGERVRYKVLSLRTGGHGTVAQLQQQP